MQANGSSIAYEKRALDQLSLGCSASTDATEAKGSEERAILVGRRPAGGYACNVSVGDLYPSSVSDESRSQVEIRA